MSTQGPLGPGTGADDSGTGTTAWSNPGNVTTEDGVFATCTLGGLFSSHYLDATNFGFSIPAGATINGISVEWKRMSGSGDIHDNAVRIIKGGTVGATDKSVAGNWSTTLGYQSYGGSSDLWGQSWTASDINASNFGAALAATTNGGDTASVDYCRITVTYTPAASTAGPLQSTLVRAANHPSFYE
jgi:hypothetical protein